MTRSGHGSGSGAAAAAICWLDSDAAPGGVGFLLLPAVLVVMNV